MNNSSVRQVLQPGIDAAIEGTVKHFNHKNRDLILGPDFARLAGNGTGRTLVTLACYADGLRVLHDAILADGEVGDKHVELVLSYTKLLAENFAKIRPGYSGYAVFERPDFYRFLRQYRNDRGAFGLKNSTTKWAGLRICANLDQVVGDDSPYLTMQRTLLSAAEFVLAVDGGTPTTQNCYENLKAQLNDLCQLTDTTAIELSTIAQSHFNAFDSVIDFE
ncbi:hypothetical protein [Calycomorphotria hydatis]|uniref:Uncharacterized protein n=1 Tax=Calycomorphotria hydatis TaxID=2528027 RepID=A0A517T8P6_9PLAN|nr:hypothetical protein [Calycomorphotria hydatis]QDT64733.1 hypothetical protein V22_19740 [Calycomorphotria hydatis]